MTQRKFQKSDLVRHQKGGIYIITNPRAWCCDRDIEVYRYTCIDSLREYQRCPGDMEDGRFQKVEMAGEELVRRLLMAGARTQKRPSASTLIFPTYMLIHGVCSLNMEDIRVELFSLIDSGKLILNPDYSLSVPESV